MHDETLLASNTCPVCAEELLTDVVNCTHGGERLERLSRVAQHMPPSGSRYANVQASWRLVLLAIATCGIYELYWFYRNWKQLKFA
jgi:Domain of unknown function (DUF4234)